MTITCIVFYKYNKISTHILTKRMTGLQTVDSTAWKFQLTSSRRGWRMPDITGNVIYISTHILTKRMTIHHVNHSCWTLFQLTSSRRGWHHLIVNHIIAKYFNSHPHEEDDWSNSTWLHLIEHFNSHPHEEDDIILSQDNITTYVFQLTSSRRGWRLQRWNPR